MYATLTVKGFNTCHSDIHIIVPTATGYSYSDTPILNFRLSLSSMRRFDFFFNRVSTEKGRVGDLFGHDLEPAISVPTALNALTCQATKRESDSDSSCTLCPFRDATL